MPGGYILVPGGYIPFPLPFGQNRVNWGGRGVPEIIFQWNPNIFVSKEPMQSFKTLGHALLGF